MQNARATMSMVWWLGIGAALAGEPAVVNRAATMENARDITNYLREELKRRIPGFGNE